MVRSPKISASILGKIKSETLRGGWTGEVYNLRRDGTEFPVELRTAVVHDAGGEPVAFVGIGRDLTERRKAEEQLYKTTSRLDLMLDNLDIVVYEFDTAGNFLLSRGKGLEKLKLKPNEVVGMSMFDLYKNYPPLINALPKALAGIPQTMEVEIEGVIWYTNFIPVKDSQGKVDRVFGISIDVTERKRAEEALRYESELWHTLMNNIPDTIYFKDRDLRFTRINTAQAEILGIPDTKDAIGKRDGDFFSTENAAQQMADEQHIISTGIPLLGKVEKVLTKGDKTHWFSTTKVPIRSNEGDIIGIVGSSREITELKQAEILESALYRIAEKTSSSSDMHNFYSSIHAIIGELMYAKNFYIALYDQEKDLLSFPYFVDEFDPQPSSRPLGHGLTAYVLRTGKSLLCDEKCSDKLYRSGEAELIGASSPVWLGVPLISEKKNIGVMVVQHYSNSRVFSKREQHILEFVSSQVAKAIEHKRAEEALRASESVLV
ncbi:MAG TPA: PAS domain-containing protein, partial [Bacteroidota bacterium]|nr:PAS domain-containing protein [Bacteroidota bacterium]